MLGHVVTRYQIDLLFTVWYHSSSMQQVDMPGRTMESIMIIVILTCSRRVLDLD